ncbi:MAG TPA: hypothetical protein VIV15_01410, partial [Anaerolineales bacterium]
RRYERNGSELFEWWDRENKRWEFDWELLKDIYIDGPDDYDEISREEALTLLQKWGVEDAEKVLGAIHEYGPCRRARHRTGAEAASGDYPVAGLRPRP